jgi:sugar-specific transcriptional regulator TrmB
MLDLTPFGFTPTESNTYQALLDLGPSSGYAVARGLSIARANAYQALDGLVAKGAAVLVDAATPKRYRVVQPRTLFARILSAQGRKIDDLERAVLEQPATGAAPHLHIHGTRALLDLAVRAVVRAEGEVRCVTAGGRLEALAPAFRARVAAGRQTSLWATEPHGTDFPVPIGPVVQERWGALGGSDAILLVADGALAATLGDDAEGTWSESTLHIGLIRAAISHITSA